MVVLTPTAMIAEINTNMPDNTTGLITPAIARATFTDMVNCGSGLRVINVKDFGAKGDGVTDDTTAVLAATAAISAAGGGMLYMPRGTYLMNQDTLTPPSNCTVQGDGIDATIILNTCTIGSKDSALTVVMTMSGGSNAGLWPANNTTYAINTPTQGAKTVTTTNAADAGNFSPGGIIMISGTTSGGAQTGSPSAFWFPSWYTTVVSANAGTGVITLAETLPIGGTQLNLVQKIVSLPKNIAVKDLTLNTNSNVGGFSGAIMEILGCENFLAERVKFVNGSGLFGAGVALGAPAKYSGFRDCFCGLNAGPIELFGATLSFIEGCSLISSYILVDGGCFDCTVINNHVKDPLNVSNVAATTGISVPSYTARVKVIGNSITGIPNSCVGIGFVDTPDAQRNHVAVGNTIVGASATSTTGINMSKGVAVGNHLELLQNGIVVESVSDTVIEGNYYAPNVTTPLSTFSGTGVMRTRANPLLQNMAGGTGTPTVQGGQSYNLTQGGAQNVTGFTGGLAGDEIVVIVQDANTTFVNSANLKMKSGVNYNPAANVVMCFICNFSGTWSEKSRSQ